MRKNYLKPEVIRVDFCTVSMLAASNREEVAIRPGQGGTAGSSTNRNDWGNLWNK